MSTKAVGTMSGDIDALALAVTKRIEREFYHDWPGGAVQTRAKVQSIIVEVLSLRSVPSEPVAFQWVYSIEPDSRLLGPFYGSIAPDLSEYPNVNITPLYPSPASKPEVTEATHRHKKRGTEYVLIGIGKMQAENWRDPKKHMHEAAVDMREVAIYRSAADTTEIWVRPREEFEDGRFEALSSIEVSP